MTTKFGNNCLVKLLLEFNPNLEAYNQNGTIIYNFHKLLILGDTALIIATRNCDLETVVDLIEAGSNLEARNDEDSTPLLIASEKGHEALVWALLWHGSDREAKNRFGETSLLIAAKNNRSSCVDHLLFNEHFFKCSDLEVFDRNGNNIAFIIFSIYKQ